MIWYASRCVSNDPWWVRGLVWPLSGHEPTFDVRVESLKSTTYGSTAQTLTPRRIRTRRWESGPPVTRATSEASRLGLCWRNKTIANTACHN